MITDEERRQIADRLHEEAENWHDFAKDDTLFDMCDATFVESILSAFQLNDMDMRVYKAFDRLADMVDCPTCRNASRYRDTFECGEYGEPFNMPLMPSRCQNCGAEVVK